MAEMTESQQKHYEEMHRRDSEGFLAIVLDMLGIKPEDTKSEELKPTDKPKPPGLLLGEELTEEEKERILPEDAKELIKALGGARCFRVLTKG